MTQARSKVVRETDNPFGDDEDEQPKSPPGPSTGPRSAVPGSLTSGKADSFSYLSKEKKRKDKDKKGKKSKTFDLEAEKDMMKATIADSSMAATGLSNILQSINREKERISENPVAVKRFEECKLLRRKVLRYVSRAPLRGPRSRGGPETD